MTVRPADGPADVPADVDIAPSFIFATCQVGAERALKAEMARTWPDFHFAFSRPGFLTFRLPAEAALPSDFDLRAVFARCWGFSLGKATGESPDDIARAVWNLAGPRDYECLHVWQRDTAPVGYRGFEPGPTPVAGEAEQSLHRTRPAAVAVEASSPPPARPGQLVLDCVVVDRLQWWVGYHRATASATSWPGGIFPIAMPPDAVSRAYLKMEEALVWSCFPVRPGERCVEIGCSPGGASQALLARGLLVTGIDPAIVDPRVLANPRFTHIKKRGADLRRREFRDFRWLAADMNVAPGYTLDTVEAIVTHEAVDIQGLLLTLKLLEWDLAAEVPGYLARIRGWGYEIVEARQLAHNRQEICVAAARDREVFKPKRKPPRRAPTPRKRR